MRRLQIFAIHLVAAFFIGSCSFSDSSIKPSRKDITQAVYASGKIFPLNHVKISAKGNGYVSKILVKAGDDVMPGTPLIIISAPNSDVNVNIAEANLRLSEANNTDNKNELNAALQDIQSAYTKYQLDSTNYERYRNLWNENITTKQTVDQAKTQAQLSFQNYKKLESVYSSLKARLATDATLAKQQLLMQQNIKGDYIITAPFKGTIYDIPVKEGQLLTTGTTSIDFGETGKFEAELDVDETDLGMISLNQPILISSDAYPSVPIYSSVREILPGVNQTNKTATVKTDIASDTLKFYSGMSIEANIIVSKKSNALVIPIDYLASDNTVTTKEKKKVPVKTGVRAMDYVEILSGIDENTELIKP